MMAFRQPSICQQVNCLLSVTESLLFCFFFLYFFCVCPSPVSRPAPTKYTAQTVNLTLLCDQPHTVDPSSMRFLREHAFDFNDQVTANCT